MTAKTVKEFFATIPDSAQIFINAQNKKRKDDLYSIMAIIKDHRGGNMKKVTSVKIDAVHV